MTRTILLLLLLTGFPLPSGHATDPAPENLKFLDELEVRPENWTREVTRTDEDDANLESVDVNLSDFYKEFSEDGKITIYAGYGYEGYYPERPAALYNMLLSLASYYDLPLDNWRLNAEQTRITFRDRKKKLDYEITIGKERSRFMDSFSKHEVVMYTGHSRYGRGPAFGSFQNYFRMGDRHDEIEVDTRNSYFDDEQILLTDRYPLKSVTLDGKRYQYQYRGQRSSQSKLLSSSFTKNIPGNDIDLKKTDFLPGRQLFYFHSCKNRKYWKDSVRSVHPNPEKKFVIGTSLDAYGVTKPDAVMIISLARAISDSKQILNNLNAVGECDSCFTSY